MFSVAFNVDIKKLFLCDDDSGAGGQLLLPLLQVGKPGVGRVVAEVLVVGREGDGVVQGVGLGGNHEGVVALVLGQFLYDVLSGQADAQSYGLKCTAEPTLLCTS